MIKATKKGTSAKFPEAVWKTGIPQKAGWVAIDETDSVKLIPKAIVELSDVQKRRIAEPTVPGVTVIPKQEIEPVKKKAVAPRAGKRGKK